MLGGPAAVRVFDAAGAPVEGATLVPSYAAKVIRFTPEAAGTYYVGLGAESNDRYNIVTGFGDAAGNATGAYHFRVATAAAADEDDQTKEARPVAFTAAAAGTIDLPGDVDLYKFQVAAGQELSWRVRSSDGYSLNARLFDSAGAPVDASGQRVFATAGTYYLGVAHYANGDYNPVTGGGDNLESYQSSPVSYELAVTLVPPDADDQIREAPVLAVETARSDSISSGTDVDLYAVTVKAGQRIGFDLDRAAGSGLNGFLRLFDVGGRDLAYDDNSPAPGEAAGVDSYIEYVFATAGTYYVGVSNGTNTGYTAVGGTGDAFDPSALGGTGGYALRLTLVS